jgi:uncharacterized protein YidB (DUF937 family)
MGLMDELLKNAGGLSGVASLAAKNPQVVAAAASLLSSNSSSIGGASGLAALAGAFQSKGLGSLMESWVGSGDNQSIDVAQLVGLLGDDNVAQFAQKAGLSLADAGPAIAAVLPSLINGLTPQGKMPETGSLESTLGGLLSSLT